MRLLQYDFAPTLDVLVLGMTSYPFPVFGIKWPFSCHLIVAHISLQVNFLASKRSEENNKILLLRDEKDKNRQPSEHCRVLFHRQLNS